MLPASPSASFHSLRQSLGKIALPCAGGEGPHPRRAYEVKFPALPSLNTCRLAASGEIVEPGEKAARAWMKNYWEVNSRHMPTKEILPAEDGDFTALPSNT